MADFEFGNDAAGQVQRLQNLVAAHAALGQLSFNWIEPIVSTTLDEFAAMHLYDSFHSPFETEVPVTDHIADAARLLDICLVQRQEILSLESEAILSALDICLARETLKANRAIAKTELAAATKVSGADFGQDGLLEQKFSLQGYAIDERLKLHNRKGSSLNYGERVAFLRKIFTQNLSRANRHVELAWRGLKLCYGLQLPEPSWVDGEDNLVGYLLDWINVATVWLRQGEFSESIHDVILYLVDDNICPDLRQYLSAIKTGGDKYFTFEIKPSDLRQFSVYSNTQSPDVASQSVRVLGLDAAFICREDQAAWSGMFAGLANNAGGADNKPRDLATAYGLAAGRMRQIRSSRTMGLEFRLPEPVLVENGSQIGIATSPVRFGAVSIWDGATARQQFRPLADKGVSDIPPFGTWQMAVDQFVHGPSGRSLFGAYLEDASGTGHPSRDLGWISDIALMIRVAIRPRLRHEAA